MASSNRTLRVTKDEWTFFGTLLPYLAMVLGAILTLLLGVITRIGIMLQNKFEHTPTYDSSEMVTWVICVSAAILSAIAWKLFAKRASQTHEPFIAVHAVLTVVFVHAWLIMAVWEDMGDWMFGAPTMTAFFYGAVIIALSWCIRRWAFSDTSNDNKANPFEEAGLGDAYLDKKNSHQIPGGWKGRLMLPIGKTIEDAKNKRIALAQIAKKGRAYLHVSETEDGVEGQVDITILNEDPFAHKVFWQSPDFPGESIIEPITYATYDTGQRPELHLAGKNGGSSQHFLTMGVSGTGKSKAWQVIYGSVLTRHDVSVVYGDPAKGMQTGGPLAAGLEWFATTEPECREQIQAIMRAIPERTNYLTSRGLDHWQPECGLNFIIFHLEEAARFADVDDLVELIEAARSAGIMIVISLQRATNDRIKTSARFNLGGNMCFGVRNKRDAAFGLSEYAIDSGASPHSWQDRFPGRHYLEATGLDIRMAGHPLMTDWVDTIYLERVVNEAQQGRRVLDNTTASAFGMVYQQYRDKVEAGTTVWQQLRNNRGFHTDTKELKQPLEHTQEELPFNVELVEDTNNTTVAVARYGFETPVEDTAAKRKELISILKDFKENGKQSFTNADIKAAGFKGRSDAWLTQNLRKLVSQGVIEYDKSSKFYRVIQ